jgi:hypothetical protein
VRPHIAHTFTPAALSHIFFGFDFDDEPRMNKEKPESATREDSGCLYL